MDRTFDYSQFQENLRRLIDSRGLSIKALGEELNMTPATLSRYLTGTRTPDLIYVVKISEYFSVSIDWILGLNGDKFDVMPKEVQEISNLYQLASSDDRRVVQAVLNKYKGV